jgi:hypothetical protein
MQNGRERRNAAREYIHTMLVNLLDQHSVYLTKHYLARDSAPKLDKRGVSMNTS